MPSAIEDYAIIGDGETVALIDRTGSLDWLCWPSFDSDACFAALLGDERHGYWRIAPAGKVERSTRSYRGEGLILETRFETADGAVTLVDFMPPRGKASDVVRLVRCDRGRVKMHMDLVIRFGFGKNAPWVRRTKDKALLAICGPDMLVLRTPVEMRGKDLTTIADFEIGAGETIPFVMAYGASHFEVPRPIDAAAALKETEAFWDEWCGRFEYDGPYRHIAMRSLVALKAMIYAPSGGIVAAPTTSLPPWPA